MNMNNFNSPLKYPIIREEADSVQPQIQYLSALSNLLNLSRFPQQYFLFNSIYTAVLFCRIKKRLSIWKYVSQYLTQEISKYRWPFPSVFFPFKWLSSMPDQANHERKCKCSLFSCPSSFTPYWPTFRQGILSMISPKRPRLCIFLSPFSHSKVWNFVTISSLSSVLKRYCERWNHSLIFAKAWRHGFMQQNLDTHTPQFPFWPW